MENHNYAGGQIGRNLQAVLAGGGTDWLAVWEKGRINDQAVMYEYFDFRFLYADLRSKNRTVPD